MGYAAARRLLSHAFRVLVAPSWRPPRPERVREARPCHRSRECGRPCAGDCRRFAPTDEPARRSSWTNGLPHSGGSSDHPRPPLHGRPGGRPRARGRRRPALEATDRPAGGTQSGRHREGRTLPRHRVPAVAARPASMAFAAPAPASPPSEAFHASARSAQIAARRGGASRIAPNQPCQLRRPPCVAVQSRRRMPQSRARGGTLTEATSTYVGGPVQILEDRQGPRVDRGRSSPSTSKACPLPAVAELR